MATTAAPPLPLPGDDLTGPTPEPSRLRRAWTTPAASWTRVVLLFFAVATITHLPAFQRTFWNPDEGFLATQARALNTESGQFYSIIVDRKPPLLPYVYAWIFRLVGDHDVATLTVIRSLAICVHVVTAILITQIAKRRFGRHGVWAGLLYLCGSAGLAPEDAQAASFEVFMLPWTCAAFLLADIARTSKSRRTPLLVGSGVACAMGTLTKQTAGATMLPVLYRTWKDRRWAGLAIVIPAFALPIIGVALWVGFGDFFFWVFTGNGGYLTSLGSWPTILARGFGNLGIFAGANAAGVLAIAYVTWRGGINKADADLWLWLIGALIGVSSGFHFFGHYFLQVLPPIVLLATGALSRNGSRLRWTMLIASSATAILFLTLAFTWPHTAQEHNNEVAQKIRKALDGAHNQPILVWGMNPDIYFMSEQEPASRFITAGFLSGFAGGGDQTAIGPVDYSSAGPLVGLARDLLKNPPRVFVDDSQDKPYAPKFVPAIDELMSTNYEVRDSVADDGRLTVIYVLKPEVGEAGVRAWASRVIDDASRWEYLHPAQ